MQSHSLSLSLLFFTSVHAVLIPLNVGSNLTSAATSDQSGLQLPTTNSSLTSKNITADHESNLNLYEFIASGIEEYHRSEASEYYASIELYKVIVSSKKPTTETGELRQVTMNFRAIEQRSGQICYPQWYYTDVDREWIEGDSRFAWGEDDEFKATNPIHWDLIKPFNIPDAIEHLCQAPDDRIPYYQRHGPWKTISIVNYKQTPAKFQDELILRFEGQSEGNDGPAHPRSFDVFVGSISGEVAIVPAEYDYIFPYANPWGWGQDNRRSLRNIGPYTYSDYLLTGVKLVTETMGNGYYKDAQLIQVEIARDFMSRHVYHFEIKPQLYNRMTLFFRWQDKESQKLISYSTDKNYDLPEMVELGNKWSTWEVTTKEYPWHDAAKYLKRVGSRDRGDPSQWLEPIDLKSLGMSILSAFAIWQQEYKGAIASWSWYSHVFLCKPHNEIDKAVDNQMIYYFPTRFVLGTDNRKWALLDQYSTTASNSTDLPLPADFRNVSAVT